MRAIVANIELSFVEENEEERNSQHLRGIFENLINQIYVLLHRLEIGAKTLHI
jgi:hypothetical protein